MDVPLALRPLLSVPSQDLQAFCSGLHPQSPSPLISSMSSCTPRPPPAQPGLVSWVPWRPPPGHHSAPQTQVVVNSRSSSSHTHSYACKGLTSSPLPRCDPGVIPTPTCLHTIHSDHIFGSQVWLSHCPRASVFLGPYACPFLSSLLIGLLLSAFPVLQGPLLTRFLLPLVSASRSNSWV